MAYKGQKVSLTAGTATALNVADVDNLPGQSLALMPCTVDLWLGGSDVTTSSTHEGARLPAGTPYSTNIDPRETLYVVSAVDTTVYVLHQGA